MLFDDLDWTYATSPRLGQTEFVRSLPEDDRNTPQIGKVFEMLVKEHAEYGEFRSDGAWAGHGRHPTKGIQSGDLGPGADGRSRMAVHENLHRVIDFQPAGDQSFGKDFLVAPVDQHDSAA